MPSKPKRPCSAFGCSELVDARYCSKHQPQRVDNRESASKRGYDSRWRKARAIYLNNNPLCVSCVSRGRLVQATVVDHIQPHKGNYTLFWDQDNWQPLCKICHDTKTATEDGGFGNVKK